MSVKPEDKNKLDLPADAESRLEMLEKLVRERQQDPTAILDESRQETTS